MKEKPAPAWLSWVQIAHAVPLLYLYVQFVPLFIAERLATDRLAINLWDGFIRLAIFLAFMFGISKVKDFKRMFEFHGRRTQSGLQLRIR